MKRIFGALSVLILALIFTAGGAMAAPRVDPELAARLANAQSSKQLCVILTFDTERITQQQIAAVKALGITTGVNVPAKTTVTVGGQPLVDNAQIPANARGLVQYALDNGLMESFPAEVRQGCARTVHGAARPAI
ncbi:MAG TPA: hypothetical protein VK619_19575 [Pyrinomonadaceae bacterium]|nr:hypothetical protein [Pyrinomonadaceae bacterium]